MTGVGVPGAQPVRRAVRPGPVGTRLRHVVVRAVRVRSGRRRHGRERRELVLGHQQGHDLLGRDAGGVLHQPGHPARGTEAHTHELPRRRVRATREWRRVPGRGDHPGQQGRRSRSRVSRVRVARAEGLRAGLVRPEGGRARQHPREQADRQLPVPRRRQALHAADVDEGRAEVLHQATDRRRELHDVSAEGRPAPVPVHRLPESGRNANRPRARRRKRVPGVGPT